MRPGELQIKNKHVFNNLKISSNYYYDLAEMVGVVAIHNKSLFSPRPNQHRHQHRRIDASTHRRIDAIDTSTHVSHGLLSFRLEHANSLGQAVVSNKSKKYRRVLLTYRLRLSGREPVSQRPCALLKLDDPTSQCICGMH